jgi:O-glycosyl hydrolase
MTLPGVRLLTLLVVISLSVIGSGSGSTPQVEGPWTETRFQTGCDPGPFHEPPPPEHLETRYPPLGTASHSAEVRVDLGKAAAQPLSGTGFNFEHALWSCPEFRRLFRSEILDAFQPAIARIDSGLLPAAPPELPAAQLNPAVYESVLSSAPYADSWAFFRRLNRAGVRLVLGVWGGPPQFTQDGTRRGLLLPRHYDDYVEYVATVVDFLVRRQHITLWATTIANEPDGGDGNQIPVDGLAYIAHQLAPRLAADGVKLYGPDTANASHALEYLPPLLDDPLVADNLAFVGFHQYYPSDDVQALVDYVHQQRPGLPVIVTEYTSFGFGDLDDGQEANAQTGFALDIAATLLSHLRQGVDAAVYWDVVDYLQPGHDAITKWGLLRGPADDFQRRTRYYGLLQILPYLQPGARVLEDTNEGDDQLHSLAVRTADGAPAIFLVNQDFVPVDLTLELSRGDASRYPELSVTRTERGRLAERVGRVGLQDGEGRLTLPPRSITTLFPAGAGPQLEDAD